MKLVIQIPCYSQGKTLAATVADLPRTLPGVDQIAFMVLLVGMLADLVGANRKLLEDALVRLRRIEYGSTAAQAAPPSAEMPGSGRTPGPDTDAEGP